jgi:hypothetical protein
LQKHRKKSASCTKQPGPLPSGRAKSAYRYQQNRLQERRLHNSCRSLGRQSSHGQYRVSSSGWATHRRCHVYPEGQRHNRRPGSRQKLCRNPLSLPKVTAADILELSGLKRPTKGAWCRTSENDAELTAATKGHNLSHQELPSGCGRRRYLKTAPSSHVTGSYRKIRTGWQSVHRTATANRRVDQTVSPAHRSPTWTRSRSAAQAAMAPSRRTPLLRLVSSVTPVCVSEVLAHRQNGVCTYLR